MKVIIIALLAGGLTPALHAAPCYCVVPELRGGFEKASSVFIGEVVEIIEPTTSEERAPLPGRFYVIKFRVHKSWKGSLVNEIRVLSGQGKYGCFAFPQMHKGEKYLVFADPVKGDDRLNSRNWSIITTCNRTAAVPPTRPATDRRFMGNEVDRRDASEDIEALERGYERFPKRPQ